MTANVSTAPIIRERRLEDSVWYLGSNLFTTLVDSSETGGRYSLLRFTSARGNEPPPHTHTREDEVFYILSGEIEGRIGDQPFRAGPGTTIHLPQGLEHHWTILSETVDVLTWFTPGGLEPYFRHPDLSVPATELRLGPPLTDPSVYGRAAQLLADYGVIMPPPPGM
ncbi:MAG: cupin domain-containing protein [Thermomicrobiales bacterium]